MMEFDPNGKSFLIILNKQTNNNHQNEYNRRVTIMDRMKDVVF